jgi:O-antigen ligase
MPLTLTNSRINNLLDKGYFSYIIAVLSVIILPVNVYYLPPLMILWFLAWIIENSFNYRTFTPDFSSPQKILFLLFIVYYLWLIAGLLYSSDTKLALSNLFGRLSLLLFPLVLIKPGELIKTRVKTIIRLFALGVFMLMLFYFTFALLRSLNLENGVLSFNPHPPEYFWLNYFYSTELTVFKHPSYVSIYVLFSVFICLESWYDKSLNFKWRFTWLLMGITHIICLYFLSSRAGILGALVLTPLYFLLKFKQNGKGKYLWIVVVLFALALLPVIKKNQRVGILYEKILHSRDESGAKANPRLIIWDITLNMVRDNLLIGVGIGDVRNELSAEFIKIGEKDLSKDRYNVHNQFLEVLLENGIIGFSIFLMIFILMSYIAISDNNILYGFFILIIILFFMFETVLYRLAGVTFFSLFSFLITHLSSEPITNYFSNRQQTKSNQ